MKKMKDEKKKNEEEEEKVKKRDSKHVQDLEWPIQKRIPKRGTDKTEEEKEIRKQKMKKGPLVRLHPKTVIPVTFFWPGPAKSVSLFYKSYFQTKWRARPMRTQERPVRWSVQVTLLPGIYQVCYLIDEKTYYAAPSHHVQDIYRFNNFHLYHIDARISPKLDLVQKVGTLFQQGNRIKGRKQIHAVLQRHELSCFKDAKERNPSLVISLHNLSDIEFKDSTSKKSPYCFQLNMPDRSHVFSSPNQEERDEWVQCIKRSTFIQKNWERSLSRYRPAPATYHNTV